MAGNWSTICDSTGNSQVHVFAFDPGNSAHILVGTEQAGIFASANGGITEMSLITDIAAPSWQAEPGTASSCITVTPIGIFGPSASPSLNFRMGRDAMTIVVCFVSLLVLRCLLARRSSHAP